jgi:hypothetical protein
VASRLTPVSASLACDDPRFSGAAEQLPGGPVIPGGPEGVLYFSEARWHTDDGIGVRGVKFAAYFDGLSGDVIAFDLHTWHASSGGRDRLAWNAVYLRCPATQDERDRTLRYARDSFEQAFRGFDHAGILDLPGALAGW